MQVSWIDPADVAALAENLRRPPFKNTPAPLPTEPEEAFLVESDMEITHTSFVEVGQEDDLVAKAPSFPDNFDDDEPLSDDEEAFDPGEDSPPPDLAAFRECLQAIRDQAIDAGLLPGVVPVQPIEKHPAVSTAEEEPDDDVWVFDVPTGNVEQRLGAFAAWAQLHIGEGEILVVDDHGDLLWGRQARPELILSTLMAWNAANRSSPLSVCGPRSAIHHTLASGKTLTVIPCHTRLGMIQVAVAGPKGLNNNDSERLRQALVASMDKQV